MSDVGKVLLVDDEIHILQAAKRVLRKNVDVSIANGPKEALEKIQAEGPFAVVVSDQNMPGMDGIKLLGLIAKKAPSTTRIMLTGNNDQQTAMKAVNDGRIFRFITKPCDSAVLTKVIAEGITQHQTLVAERELLEQTLSGSIKMLVDIIAMSKPHAHLRSTTVQRWSRKVIKTLETRPTLEQGLSAMLCTLGYLTLPDELAERYFKGDTTTPEEKRSINEAVAQARDLVLNIPRMEGIADAIYYCRKGYDGTGYPADDVKEEDLPEAARILCPLMDLAEAASVPNRSFEACMAELVSNAPRYDPKILEAMRVCLGGDQTFQASADAVRMDVTLARLLAGDLLAEDIRDPDGRLLLAAGSAISDVTIKRLRAVPALNASEKTITVWRTAKSSQDSSQPESVVS